MEIDRELYKEIKEYCDLNGLKARDYIHKLLKEAFMKDKYGERPAFMPSPHKRPKPEIVTTVIQVESTKPAEEPVNENAKIEEPVVTKEKQEEEIVKTIETKSRKRKLS